MEEADNEEGVIEEADESETDNENKQLSKKR